MAPKPKLSIYWASSCGGCEIAVVNLHENLLALNAHFDLVFCPCLLDTKISDLESMPDRSIAVTLFNGAIGSSENEHMARLLRAKSQLLVAFGSCASEGGIPALGNLYSSQERLRTIYLDNASSDNPAGSLPQVLSRVPEGELALPRLYERARRLRDVVDVDYSIPGCPPEPHQIWTVVEALMQGGELPPQGSILGGGRSTVCEECLRRKQDKTVRQLQRFYETIPDPEQCLLEQGILCMGIATREGCGALCPRVNMPCTGCYGPPEGVRDQGAKMISALGSMLAVEENQGLDHEQVSEHSDVTVHGVPDLAGTLYKYALAGSLLGGKAR